MNGPKGNKTTKIISIVQTNQRATQPKKGGVTDLLVWCSSHGGSQVNPRPPQYFASSEKNNE